MSQHSPSTNGRRAAPVPAAAPPPAVALQPDAPFIILTLTEELAAANGNRIYLMSMLKQMQTEFAEAQAQWQLERDSLKAGRTDVDPG